MKIDLVFLVILGFMVLRTVCNNKTDVKEHMAAADDMKAAINAIYNADISAIQNLTDIAKRLQEGGLTVAGDLKITGALNVAGALNVTGAVVASASIKVGGELLLDNGGHECHFFNTNGEAGIWYHKSGEAAKVVRFDGGTNGGFSYGTEINALKARCDALEAKCQFITTVASSNTSTQPNIMTFYSQVIIDCQYHGIPNVQPTVALIIKNDNELNILNRENTSKIAFFNGSRPRMWSPDTGTRWIRHTDE